MPRLCGLFFALAVGVLSACTNVTPVPDSIAFTEESVASTTTTLPPPPTTCRTDDYEVSVPGGWYNHECRLFSARGFDPAAVSSELDAEIELVFSTTETYAEVLAHVESTSTILRQQAVEVDGLIGRQFVSFENRQERVIVVVDVPGAVLVALATSLESIGDIEELSLTDHYAQTKVRLADVLRTISITERPATSCPAPSSPNVDVVGSVEANIDADAELETVLLLRDAGATLLAIDQVGPNGGTAWAPVVRAPNLTIDSIQWRDLDLDGIAEILYRVEGSPSRQQFGVRTVEGCSLVPVVDGAGVPVVLESYAFGERAENFTCVFGPGGELTSIERTRTLLRTSDRTVLRHERTPWTYRSGVLRAGETVVEQDPVEQLAPDDASLETVNIDPVRGLESCQFSSALG